MKLSRKLSPDEKREWCKVLTEYIEGLQNAPLVGIPDPHRWKLKEAMVLLKAGNLKFSHIKALFEYGRNLEQGKDAWFKFVSKLLENLGTGKTPKGKYQRIKAAEFIYNFIIRGERPSSTSLISEIRKSGRSITAPEVSLLIEELGKKGLEFYAEERGVKST